MRATEVVQQRLLAAAKPETQAEIRRVLEKISGQMGASDQPKHDFSKAKATVRKAAAGAPPDEKKIAGFAAAGRYEETTVGLAAICKVPLEVVDRMMSGRPPGSRSHSLQSSRFFVDDHALDPARAPWD